MHHTDRSKFSNVHIEALRLLQTLAESSDHLMLDAVNGLSLATHCHPHACRGEVADLVNPFVIREKRLAGLRIWLRADKAKKYKRGASAFCGANQISPVTPYIQGPIHLPNSISLKTGDLYVKCAGHAILPITDTIVEAPWEGKQL
jgi:hypothetical protein